MRPTSTANSSVDYSKNNIGELEGINLSKGIIAPATKKNGQPLPGINRFSFQDYCDGYKTSNFDPQSFYGGWEDNDNFKTRIVPVPATETRWAGFSGNAILRTSLELLGWDGAILNLISSDPYVSFRNSDTPSYFADEILRVPTFKLLAQLLDLEGKKHYYTTAYLSGFISLEAFNAIRENFKKVYGVDFIIPDQYHPHPFIQTIIAKDRANNQSGVVTSASAGPGSTQQSQPAVSATPVQAQTTTATTAAVTVDDQMLSDLDSKEVEAALESAKNKLNTHWGSLSTTPITVDITKKQIGTGPNTTHVNDIESAHDQKKYIFNLTLKLPASTAGATQTFERVRAACLEKNNKTEWNCVGKIQPKQFYEIAARTTFEMREKHAANNQQKITALLLLQQQGTINSTQSAELAKLQAFDPKKIQLSNIIPADGAKNQSLNNCNLTQAEYDLIVAHLEAGFDHVQFLDSSNNTYDFYKTHLNSQATAQTQMGPQQVGAGTAQPIPSASSTAATSTSSQPSFDQLRDDIVEKLKLVADSQAVSSVVSTYRQEDARRANILIRNIETINASNPNQIDNLFFTIRNSLNPGKTNESYDLLLAKCLEDLHPHISDQAKADLRAKPLTR